MDVLRDSRSTLLAMLEAFLYDPLLSWTVSTATLKHASSMIESRGLNCNSQVRTTFQAQPKLKKLVRQNLFAK